MLLHPRIKEAQRTVDRGEHFVFVSFPQNIGALSFSSVYHPNSGLHTDLFIAAQLELEDTQRKILRRYGSVDWWLGGDYNVTLKTDTPDLNDMPLPLPSPRR